MKKLLFPVVLISLFISCVGRQISLPDTIPSEFQLVYKIDGGITNYSVIVKLFNDSVEVVEKNEDKKSIRKEKLGVSALEQLYAVIQAAHPEKIKATTVKGNVPERGGRSLELKWNENKISLSDAGNSFIAEDNYENWMLITEEIEKVAKISR